MKFIFALTAVLIAPFAEGQICKGNYIYQNHGDVQNHCPIPENAMEYNWDRTAACGAETFNTCTIKVKVGVSGTFGGHFNEMDPSGPPIGQCRGWLKDDDQRKKFLIAISGIADNGTWVEGRFGPFLRKPPHPGVSVEEVGPDVANETYEFYDSDVNRRGKLALHWTGLSQIPNATLIQKINMMSSAQLEGVDISAARRTGEMRAGSDWWFMDCDFSATLSLDIIKADPSCGARTYKSCQHKNHGIKVSVVKKYCPVDETKYSLLNFADGELRKAELLEGGEVTCATLDQMTEDGAAAIASKIAALKKNLAILKGAKMTYQILPKSRTVTASIPNEPLLSQLQILFEIYRLGKLSNRSADVKEASDSIREKFKHDGGLVDTLLMEKQFEMLKSLQTVLPEEIQKLAEDLHSSYATMGSEKYAFLYSNGITLTDEELYDIPAKIEISNDSRAIYRMSEAAVRTGLEKIAKTQSKVLDLMDLKIQAYRETTDLVKLVNDLAPLSNSTAAEISRQLAPYRQSSENLKSALNNLITSEIEQSESSIARTKKTLWGLIDLAKKSSDSRVALLSGYRALNEVSALNFGRALNTAILASSQAASAIEFTTSLNLLVNTANKNLATIRVLLLLNEVNSSEQDTIVGTIRSKIADSTTTDQVVSQLVDILARLPSTPGFELGLANRIGALLKENYQEFQASMRKIPEFKLLPTVFDGKTL